MCVINIDYVPVSDDPVWLSYTRQHYNKFIKIQLCMRCKNSCKGQFENLFRTHSIGRSIPQSPFSCFSGRDRRSVRDISRVTLFSRSSLLIPVQLIGCWILLWGITVASEISVFDSELLQRIEQAYGVEGRERVVKWDMLMRSQRDTSDLEKLERVNEFFNALNFVSDIQHWGEEDYWATPIEFLGSDAGDCEDFTVAKYFTLKYLGVPIERMNLTYVKALRLNQAHMVLTYFATPDADPLVLDNLIEEIRPASKRLDLLPVYSFNGDKLWLAKERGRGRMVGNSSQLGSWTELARRMGKNGMKKSREK